jgi:pyridoxamine-phosphate oxidase
VSETNGRALAVPAERHLPEFGAPPADPVPLLRGWFEDAIQLGVAEPGALALATTDADGNISNRIVKVLGITARGLVFTSHADSQKGRDLAVNAWASGVFYWRELGQQMIITGPVERLSNTESDALWEARPAGTHAMSVASHQSSRLDDEQALRTEARRLNAAGERLPRPARWLGYLLIPAAVEFWHIGTERLHLRLRYDLANGAWAVRRLQP